MPGSMDAQASADDLAFEGALRPRSLAEFVGQSKVRGQLQLLLDAAAKSGAIRSDVGSEDVLLAVGASTWAFVNDGEWEERSGRVLRLVMDGLRYKPMP